MIFSFRKKSFREKFKEILELKLTFILRRLCETGPRGDFNLRSLSAHCMGNIMINS